MKATVRPLKAEEAMVLALHDDTPRSLRKIERAMGPRGKRSPAAESHAFLADQGLIAEGIDRVGNPTPHQYVLTDAGAKVLPRGILSGLQDARARLAAANNASLPEQERERLRHMVETLEPLAPEDVEEPEEDEEEDPIEEEEDEEPAPAPVPRAKGKLVISLPAIPKAGKKAAPIAPRRTSGKLDEDPHGGRRVAPPAAPLPAVAGQRRGGPSPTTAPRRAK